MIQMYFTSGRPFEFSAIKPTKMKLSTVFFFCQLFSVGDYHIFLLFILILMTMLFAVISPLTYNFF